MVRRQLKNKGTKNPEPKQTKLTNDRRNAAKNSIENQLTRVTRSKSSGESNKIKGRNNIRLNSASHNTRLKGKENILPLPNLSPRKTRSKSKKIETINFNLDSNIQKTAAVINKKEQQTKISVRAQFVKIIDLKVDSIVLSKQKYSVSWPSRVLNIEKERVFVYFFGDKRSGYVAKSEIYDFLLSKKAVQSLLGFKKNPRAYRSGIAEIDMLYVILHR